MTSASVSTAAESCPRHPHAEAAASAYRLLGLDAAGRRPSHGVRGARPADLPARDTAGSSRGGLAPWQERLARQLPSANLAAAMPLADIARACRLSRSHFSQAFRQTIGETPHAWLTRHRVAAAQAMMRERDDSLAEIALARGFSDQSHLTRVFGQRVGLSPARWRRLQSI